MALTDGPRARRWFRVPLLARCLTLLGLAWTLLAAGPRAAGHRHPG